MSKILIVDDEVSIRNVISVGLREQGYEVCEAESVERALKSLVEQAPHLVLLDLGLADGHGLQFLEKVRVWSQVPIVVLTVDDSEEMKVRLLEAGADDYVTKPFGMPELWARIKVALRHAQAEPAVPFFQSGQFSVNLLTHEVWRNGKPVRLTATEFAILRLLIRGGGRVISQEQLLSEIWGPLGLENPHYIRIYIGHLRKKIEENPSLPQLILTEAGVGYRLRSSSM